MRTLIAVLSALYTDLVEQGITDRNPARELPRTTRRLVKPSHDPRTTPFVEKLDDVRRIYLDLPEPLNVAYAIGALAGLRTGEVFALRWPHVDLAARRIHARESVSGPLKDKDSRMVPILDGLYPGAGAVEAADGRRGAGDPLHAVGGGADQQAHSGEAPPRHAEAPRAGAVGLGWYEATRHTFASQWVLGGGSIEVLKEIMGHSSVVVTERYTHLRPDLFVDRERSTIPLALNPAAAPLRANWAEFGQREPRDASQPTDSEDKRPEWSCKPSSVPPCGGWRTFI